MDAGEWAEVERLFDIALQLHPEERSAWLDDVCAGKAERRNTLVRLLRKFDEPSRDVRDEQPIFDPGQLVAGRFQVVQLIARGGMGEVYKVRDQKLHGLQIALKTIRADVASQQAALQRFLREVWVPREISDDGICRMFELVEHRQKDLNGQEVVIACLTMQFLDGEPLSSFLARRRPLPVGEALELARQIGRSLQVLHDNGIIHRDLKPSNVMMQKKAEGRYHPVIIDFGLAKRSSAEGLAWETQTAPLPGAPYFLAPEIFQGHKGSVASDVYSFGLLIDSLVTCRNAFSYLSDEELVYRKLNEEPEAPSQRNIGLPKVWEAVILACLRRDPALRPKRAVDVVLLLEEAAGTELIPKAEEPVVEQRSRGRTRRGWIAAASLAGVTVSAAGIAAISGTSLEGELLVLPIRNLTTRPEYEQLCMGTGHELVRRLRSFQRLQVFSVSPSWKLDQRELQKARFSLESSLQVVDGSPWISARIYENLTGRSISEWKLPASIENPAGLEKEMADRTVEGLHDALSTNRVAATIRSFLPQPILAADEGMARPASAVNAAFALYQRGQQISLTRSPASALEAIACFERAIALDGKFALAFAALADIQQVLLLFNRGRTKELLGDALGYAEKAVSLDSSLPECHVSKAAALQNLWDWRESEKSYLTAIAANGRHPKAHSWYAGLILQFGRMSEGLGFAKKGLELDPFDHLQQSTYGLYLWLAGKPTEAAQHLEGVLGRTNLINAHINLGQAYATLAGEASEPDATVYFSKAIAAASEVRTRELASAGGVDPGYLKWSDLMFIQAYARRGDMNAARLYTQRLERGFLAGNISASAVAWGYSMVWEPGRAIELLRIGQSVREREMLYLKIHPLFRNLERESGFQQLVREMNL